MLQQLTNAATAARYREVIVSVLNYLNTNSRVGSPPQQILSPISTIPATGVVPLPPNQSTQQNSAAGIPPPGSIIHSTSISGAAAGPPCPVGAAAGIGIGG